MESRSPSHAAGMPISFNLATGMQTFPLRCGKQLIEIAPREFSFTIFKTYARIEDVIIPISSEASTFPAEAFISAQPAYYRITNCWEVAPLLPKHTMDIIKPAGKRPSGAQSPPSGADFSLSLPQVSPGSGSGPIRSPRQAPGRSLQDPSSAQGTSGKAP